MPNATVRVADKGLPKSAPKRDPLPTAADLRQHAADLRSAVALLEAAKVVERQLAEPNEERKADGAAAAMRGSPPARHNSDLESAVLDVRAWASIMWELWNETDHETDDTLPKERLDRVLEKVHEAAEELFGAYYDNFESDERAAQ